MTAHDIPMSILLAAAAQADRDHLRNYLSSPSRGARFVFTEAENGLAALERLKANTFSCVFLDYALPDVDGIAVLRALPADRPGSPVVILIPPGNEAVMQDALTAGAQDYLLKDAVSHATARIAMTKARALFDAQSARHEAEAQLLHARRMESVGQITSGIAHDFNNILSVISASVHLLMRESSNASDTVQERLASIQESVVKGGDLVRRLSIFTNDAPLSREVVGPNDLVKDAATLLRRTLEESVEVRLSLDKQAWSTETDAGALNSALISLAANARDAMMPDGGTLTLETGNTVLTGAGGGEYVMIAVSDTGIGMAPEVKERIFDPYFTTKPGGRNAGLGLTDVYAFVRQSKGQIRVHSTPRCGTTVRMYLPRFKSLA